jgi:hypothetical protein
MSGSEVCIKKIGDAQKLKHATPFPNYCILMKILNAVMQGILNENNSNAL